MSARTHIGIGAIWAAIGVACGAFGAHGLEERLEAAGQLANWHTAVRFQVWHALALIAFALYRERRPGGMLAAWGFLIGSALFSGSIYVLALEPSTNSFLWPLTPLGGLLLLIAWVAFAASALRRPA